MKEDEMKATCCHKDQPGHIKRDWLNMCDKGDEIKNHEMIKLI